MSRELGNELSVEIITAIAAALVLRQQEGAGPYGKILVAERLIDPAISNVEANREEST